MVLTYGVAACGGAEFPQSSLHPVSDAATSIDDLYRGIFWWAVFVFVVVETLLVVAIFRFRDRPGREEPKHVHGNTLVEIAWTLAPAVILVFIAVPTIQTIFEVDGAAPDDALQVEVTGRQWWWEIRYPELGIVTANELHVPRGRPVQLTLTSADVIHSFWVPRLHGKRDLNPGRTTRLAFTADSAGYYYGQCAEYCGESHANMRLRLVVDTPGDWDAWVSQHQTPPAVDADTTDSLVQAGLAAFMRVRDPASNSCFACHAIQGVAAGVLGPNLTYVGSRTTVGAGLLPNDSAGLAAWLRDPPGVKPGNKMPDVNLTDDEIAALVAYLRSRD